MARLFILTQRDSLPKATVRLCKQFFRDPFEKKHIYLPCKRTIPFVQQAFLKEESKTIILPCIRSIEFLYDQQEEQTEPLKEVGWMLSFLTPVLPKTSYAASLFIAQSLLQLYKSGQLYLSAWDHLKNIPQELLTLQGRTVFRLLEYVAQFWSSFLGQRRSVSLKSYQKVPFTLMAGIQGSLPITRQILKEYLPDPGTIILFPFVPEFQPPYRPQHPLYNFWQTLLALDVKYQDVRPFGSSQEGFSVGAQCFLDSYAGGDLTVSKNGTQDLQMWSCSDSLQEVQQISRALFQTVGNRFLVSSQTSLGYAVALTLKSLGKKVHFSEGFSLFQNLSISFLLLVLKGLEKKMTFELFIQICAHPLFKKAHPEVEKVMQVFLKDLLKENHIPDCPYTYLNSKQGSYPYIYQRIAQFFENSFYSLIFKETTHLLDHWMQGHLQVAEHLLKDIPWLEEETLIFFQNAHQASQAYHPLSLAGYKQWLEHFLQQPAILDSESAVGEIYICPPSQAGMLLDNESFCILGSVCQNHWPRPSALNPWMGRDMQRALNLPSASHDVGQGARDFLYCLQSSKLVLTRQICTPASRFWIRLEAGLKKNGYLFPLAAKTGHIKNNPFKVDVIPTIRQQAPIATLSASDLQLFLDDAYSFYLKKILKLWPQELFSKARNTGLKVHSLLEDFIKITSTSHDLSFLDRHMETLFATLGGWTFFEALRWKTVFKEFAFQEGLRRQEQKYRSFTEVWARLPLVLAGRPVCLVARADRLDCFSTYLEIIDYKTGRISPAKDIKESRSIQLLFLAFLAQEGAFEGIKSSKVQKAGFWKVSQASGSQLIWHDPKDWTDWQEKLRDILKKLEACLQGQSPYRARPGHAFTKVLSRQNFWAHAGTDIILHCSKLA
jgi:RecB family exonuclease